jgi:hypothetical protein
VGFISQVLSETACVVVEGRLMFFVPCGKLFTSLSNIRLMAVRASQFIYS